MVFLKFKYTILIKSHCAYPDYEDEVEAENKIEAAKLFAKNRAMIEYNWQELLPFIELSCGEKMKTIEDIVDQLFENMDFDTLIIWANELDVEVNYPPLDDMWPDWENELRVEVAETMLKVISPKTEVANADMTKLAISALSIAQSNTSVTPSKKDESRPK